MDYNKLSINNLFSNLFIMTVFMSDFGLVVSGQPIYFFQILASIYLVCHLAHSLKIEKGWLFFFIATLISIVANGPLLFETRKFAGDAYPWTSIKGLINVLLFYAVYKTTLFSYKKINPNFFLYFSIFMILYGLTDLLFGSNILVNKVLNLFHTNPRALAAETPALFGREASYSALGCLVAVCILINYNNKNLFNHLNSVIVFLSILLLIYFVIILKSKSGYLSLAFLSIFFSIYFIKKKTKSLRTILQLSIFVALIYFISKNFIGYGWLNNIIDSISGTIGSGSTYTRWVSLRVSLAIFSDNILFGVGVGNFKLFYTDYVHLLNFPIEHDLKYWTNPLITSGSIDPLNYFAGILSEFGIITFLIVFYLIFTRLYLVFKSTKNELQKIPLSLIVLPVIFGASLGFYYWAVPFFPLFLAILKLDYEKYKQVI